MANQQNKAGAGQNHVATLTQAGCPAPHAQKIAATLGQAGVNPDDLVRLSQMAPTFNWGLLAQLVGQFGPSIVGAIISLFGQGGSAPQPQPQAAP